MPNIEFLNVPVDQLRKNPWNTNRVSVDHESKIRNSISRNGMFKPIIVRQVAGISGYEIIGGEHRWEQAVSLGHTEVPIANLGEIEESKAKEIGVIDNVRYGADDTLMLADLLKGLGTAEELQNFLPFGSADLDAIFSASDITLDDLEIDETYDLDEDSVEKDVKPEKIEKTHTIMRFKVSLGDAETLTARISRAQKDHGFTASDDLTNAGDALVHILTEKPAAAPEWSLDEEDIDEVLDALSGEAQEMTE